MVEQLTIAIQYFFLTYHGAVLVGTVLIICWLLWQERSRTRAEKPKAGCKPTKTGADEQQNHRPQQPDAQPQRSSANKPTAPGETADEAAPHRRHTDQATNGDQTQPQEKPDVETK